MPKSGGRRRGTPNRNTAQTRERIAKEADPIGQLIKIANGKRFEAAAEVGDQKRTFVFPTMEQRIHAITRLADKVIPNLKAVEVQGDGTGQLIVQLMSFKDGANPDPQ